MTLSIHKARQNAEEIKMDTKKAIIPLKIQIHCKLKFQGFEIRFSCNFLFAEAPEGKEYLLGT